MMLPRQSKSASVIPLDANIEPHQLVSWSDKALVYDGTYYVSYDTWGRIRSAQNECERREILTRISAVDIPDRSMNSGGNFSKCEQTGTW